MKKVMNVFSKSVNGGKQNSVLSMTVCTVLFSLIATSMSAQADAGASSPVLFESGLTYLYICLGLFVASIAYYVYDAKKVLQRNGKSMDVPVPSFRWMAGHGKFVAILFFLVVLVAIIWAIKF